MGSSSLTKDSEMDHEGHRTDSPESGTVPGAGDSRALQDLLVKSSRTFALAIPLLPEPIRRQVTLAYLLFRIADTFEDASVFWTPEEQIAALRSFRHLLQEPSVEAASTLAAGWLERPPSDHAGYLELIARTPEVFKAFLELEPGAREVIVKHTARTSEGMISIIERSDDRGVLELGSIPELQEYCYIVAGIVGEMLTDLFVLGSDALEVRAEYLRDRAAAFGEGLQLVNILRDSASDATEGRSYVPTTVDRAEIFELARSDLGAAAEYILAIQEAGGPDGVVLFTGITVGLAWPTLDLVEKKGPGAKIKRSEVFAIQARLRRAVAKGRPAISIPS